MSSDSDKYIPIPEDIDYRVSDFYDMDEDLRNTESARIYDEYSNTQKRYTDVSKIASGGMKKVSRAFDQKTTRYVALAELKEDMAEETHSPFLAEARLTAALHHPNIIKVHDIDFNESKKPYFTMDLKLGDSLSEIITKLKKGKQVYSTKYKLEELLDIFLKVCDALSYSHSQGVLHLDLKPENIQVGEHGEVLLCDWGLAKYKENTQAKENELLDNSFLNGQTVMGKVRGTPGYMAPEMINDKKKRCEQSDIYALGALLYSLLTLQPPMEGDTETILKFTTSGKLIPPIERSPKLDIPTSLNAVVMKAMSFEISDRYKSVNDVAEDVKNYLYGYSTSAENAGLVKEISLFYKRNKLPSLISCAAIAMLIAFIFILENSRQNEKKLRLTAENEKLKAQENFRKYKDEKEMADMSLSTDPSSVLAKLKEYYHANFLNKPKETLDYIIKSLERVKQSNESDQILYEFKGDIHFVRQEFDLAFLELQKGRGEEENTALFKGLASIKDYKSNGLPAPVEVIKELIKNLDGQYVQQLLRLLIYDNVIRTNKDEHLELVKEVFMTANKIPRLEEFSYSASKKSLLISGDCSIFSFRYKQHKADVSLLRTLNLKHLKLKNNNAFHAKQFYDYKLESLDLRGITLFSGRQVIAKGIAEKIIVSKDLVEPKLLKSMQNNCTLLFEP